MMKPVLGDISAPFDQPRPLGSDSPTHVHGGIDIPSPVGTQILAPEAGTARAWIATRYRDNQYWPEPVQMDDGDFPFANYFLDMYGGIIVLRSADRWRTHIIAHCFGNQIFNRRPMGYTETHWAEESTVTRWPIHAIYTDEVQYNEGELLGYVGNAGYSTGPHIHWEIHHGYRWNSHEKRIDPAAWLAGEQR
jgi:hypothetical protein